MRSRLVLAMLASLTLVLTMVLPAGAITYPTPDDGAHPQVGQLLFYDPSYQPSRYGPDDPGAWFTCSGTLLSETIVLTAGHCTWGVGEDGDENADGREGTDIWITFEEAADYDMLKSSDTFQTNSDRYDAWSAELDASPLWIRGTAFPHPDYVDAAFLLYDAGVVVLDDEVELDEYAELPEEGYLDQFLRTRRNSQRFTPVGYGLNTGFPFFSGGDTRSQASVMLVNAIGVFGIGPFAPDTSVVFSSNNGKAHRGGTCFGDSGGPVFDAGTLKVVAVTSFGVNLTCTGTGGGYRIDQPDDLSFIESFLSS